MARFFIDRPVFAWVLALLVMLAGTLALFNLPVAQFPPLAPPAIGITVTYPGASAQTVENTGRWMKKSTIKAVASYESRVRSSFLFDKLAATRYSPLATRD